MELNEIREEVKKITEEFKWENMRLEAELRRKPRARERMWTESYHFLRIFLSIILLVFSIPFRLVLSILTSARRSLKSEIPRAEESEPDLTKD